MHRKITYKIVESKEPLTQEAFDPLGALGYELVSVIHYLKQDHYIYHFKHVDSH